MTLEITLDWWLLPFAVTIMSGAWALWFCSTEEVQRGGMFPSFPVYGFIAVPVWVIASLSAWLIWSLMT